MAPEALSYVRSYRTRGRRVCIELLQMEPRNMPAIDRVSSALLMVDFQTKLMPAIEEGMLVIANARRLVYAAEMFQIPALFTEENVDGLGRTLPELRPGSIAHKMTFDACRAADFLRVLPNRHDFIISGCEAHVCVLQTVMGLLSAGRRVYVVRDALGSRRSESKETAIRRMEQNGAEIVTTEMVIFEWLGTAEDPRLRDAIALVK
jgi:nicotinamidase-related amidase